MRTTTARTLPTATFRPAAARVFVAVFLFYGIAAGHLAAQTEHRWIFGVLGSQNILDTYLSPLEYSGGSHGTFHRSERPSHWGRGRVNTVMQMASSFCYAKSPTDDGKELDAQLTLGGGFVRVWHPGTRWRLSTGGLGQGSGGFTYNTRNGNNPAQGRLAAELVATGTCEYSFPLWRRTWKARAQLDAPLLGAMFSPAYGQSYYDLFSLGHYDHNIRLTHPGNAPTMRLLTTLDVPLGHIRLTVGYHADIRQSHVNGLKRHAWSHSLVLGFVRYVKRLKPASDESPLY